MHIIYRSYDYPQNSKNYTGAKNMDLHYLEIFNTVAKYESFKKASETLYISQPALSVQIKKLEEQIGLKLFDKIGNKICLSENGIMLFNYTKKIFEIVGEIENNISDKKEFIGGTLNIGGSNTPGTYILPEIIGEFKKTYPGININLHIANTAEIAHLINNGTLDVAINGGSCIYSTYIAVEKILEDRLVLITSPQNYCNSNSIISIDELKEMSFVVHKTDSQLYTYYKKYIDELNVEENVSMCLGNIDAIKKAVSSNLGITLIPHSAVKLELQFGILKELKIDNYQLMYPYNLIYNKNKFLSITTKKFIELIRASINNYNI